MVSGRCGRVLRLYGTFGARCQVCLGVVCVLVQDAEGVHSELLPQHSTPTTMADLRLTHLLAPCAVL
jgi:hypothetical protein